jgi:Domain of unknown function (DUF1850)
VRSRRLLTVGVAAAPLVLAATALSGPADRELVVRDERGGEVLRTELPESGRFAIAYRHSYYRAPARELFRAAAGELRLRGIESPRAAVLDYYALAGKRTSRRGWLRLVPDERPSYDSLPLIATATGRRTLVVEGERHPLYGRDARHLTIEVEG